MKARIKHFFSRVKKVITRPDMIMLPGQLAFFLVLAIIPTLTLFSYVASVLNLSLDFISNFLTKAFSKEVANVLLSTSAFTNSGIRLALLLIFCYYISSNGAVSLIMTSNKIYGISNGKWYKRRLKAILISFILVVSLLALLIIPVFGDRIMQLIIHVNLNSHVTDMIYKVFQKLQSPIMWVILFFIIKVIYIIAPDKKIKSHNTNYGALFTTISWIIMTMIYSYYVNEVADFGALYGGWATLCMLMIWIYFISFFFVIGMSLNYQRENEKMEKTIPISLDEIEKSSE